MKGLIVKDIFCLKKQIVTFAFIIYGVVAVAVMFALSGQFGNLSTAASELAKDGFDIVPVIKTAVMFFMVLPLVCTGNIADLFVCDKDASFYKVGASLPISLHKRVLSKFLTAFVFIALGLAVDVLMSAVIAGVSDIIVYSKCVSTFISLTACMMVFVSVVIMLNYAGVPAMYSSFAPVVIAAAALIALNAKRMITAFKNDDFSSMSRVVKSIIASVETKPFLFIAAAVCTAVICYFASVYFAGRKRGVA